MIYRSLSRCLRSLLVASNRSLRIAEDRLVDPVGRVEPQAAQVDEASGFSRLPILTYDPKEPRGNSGVHGRPLALPMLQNTGSVLFGIVLWNETSASMFPYPSGY